jgi:hypothetical protein
VAAATAPINAAGLLFRKHREVRRSATEWLIGPGQFILIELNVFEFMNQVRLPIHAPNSNRIAASAMLGIGLVTTNVRGIAKPLLPPAGWANEKPFVHPARLLIPP